MSLLVRLIDANRRKSYLVDPHSLLYKQVVGIFKYFEYGQYITVFQPQKGRLTVNLDRLEISFFVNGSGLLQSHQLGAYIPATRLQDPGIWYGSFSHIVIQSVTEPDQYSVLVPLGQIRTSIHGPHIELIVRNSGAFVRYGINRVLGRVECPAESHILFMKALLHAYTSYFIVDGLTGRTGLEEALGCLQSGLYQPWQPISRADVDLLLKIAELTPWRSFYPPGLKCMKNIAWRSNVPIHVQDDRYRLAVGEICARLSDLEKLSPASGICSTIHLVGNDYLEARAMSRLPMQSKLNTFLYISRDRPSQQKRRQNVLDIAQLLFDWRQEFWTTDNLASLLGIFPGINGFNTEYTYTLITDLLKIDVGMEFGALATTALKSSGEDKYRLVFLLGTIASSPGIDMTLLRTFCAMAIFPEVKRVTVPPFLFYENFKYREVPQVDHVISLVDKAKTVLHADDRFKHAPRGEFCMKSIAHRKEAVRICESFAKQLLEQWPAVTIDQAGFKSIDKQYFNIVLAIKLIEPEWSRYAANNALSSYINSIHPELARHGVARSSADLSILYQCVDPTSTRYKDRAPSYNMPTLSSLLQSPVLSLHNTPVSSTYQSQQHWFPISVTGSVDTKHLSELRDIAE